jgi:hypothetical protein
MIPASLQIVHALENHEHVICTSLIEQHLHEENLDCGDFHKQLTVYSIAFTSHLDVIPAHYFTTIFIDKPQSISEVYYSKKSSRGPPAFTI